MGKAIEPYHKALAVALEIGDRRGEGNRLGSLGAAYRKLGQVKQAIEMGDRRKESLRCWNLGALYEEINPEQAVNLMSVRVVYEREVGHSNTEANARRVAKIKAHIQREVKE